MVAAEEIENVYKLLEPIFETCITQADNTDLINNFSDLYDSFTTQGFEKSFKNILQIILSERKRSNDVRKLLYFIAECAVTMDNKFKNANPTKEETEEVMTHPFLKNLIKILAQWSAASSCIIRSRSCQLLYMILTYIQDHGIGEIDLATYESIYAVVETRRLDVKATVRASAVLLAKFFQDPSTVNDPVIAGLCWQMQFDPNPQVRLNIVSVIAACEETVILIAKRFLYDKNPKVRNAALLHICTRISPRSFTKFQRIQILKQCFYDTSELVRDNAEHRLIPVWFRVYKDKLSKFVMDLRMGNESLDKLPFMDDLLRVFAKCIKIRQIVEEIELDLNNCLPKPPLTGEKIFLWHHFWELAHKDNRLSRFIAPPHILIEYIITCFTDSAIYDQPFIFNELISFLWDILDATGIGEGEKIFPALIDMMKNPFVSHDIMPYLISFYLTFVPEEKDIVHDQILGIIEDLQKMLSFTPVAQGKNIFLKCFAIASQILTNEDMLSNSIRSIKDKLIVAHLDSEDVELKIQAITTLCLYCHLDIKEAKLSWPSFYDGIHIGSSSLKYILLKSAFDILKCHGQQIFSVIDNDGDDQLNAAVENILSNMEDDETEREIVVQGSLKLFIVNHTRSPTLLAKLIVLYFHPDEYHSTQFEIEEFLKIYGNTMERAECLNLAFLEVINFIFTSEKIYHNISIKTVALQLIEFSKQFENCKLFTLEDKFSDLIVLDLTKKHLKKPWRFPAPDLYGIFSSNMPKKLEVLFKLKGNLESILKRSHSPQTKPGTRNVKQFSNLLKKIQVAIEAAPLNQSISTSILSPVKKTLYLNDDSQSSSNEPDIEVDTFSEDSLDNSEMESPNPRERSFV